ncbi:MAG: PASTA domain-containing protein, partial [Clostridia bacterium]|nr:PASTA domain-containing protein [Clostridia bacterium]
KEPVNTIIKQYPLPDKEVKLKAELVLYISRGEHLVKVPEIEVGADQKTAAAKLSAAGFTVKEVTANSDKVEKGCVIRIDPVSGEELAKGSTVTMYVSIGEEPVDNVVVPDVVGRAQEDAIKRLTEKGLKVNEDDIVRINHPSYSAGVVIETNPAMGDSVAPDTKVILTVSSGYKDVPVSINMPDVSAAVDMDIYIDDDWWYSQEDITSNAPMSFTFDEQKDSYTVTVELSKAGANDYQTYAVFEIDGESGSVTSSEYSTFTIKTTTKTKATTTTTSTDEDDKVTTTTASDDEDAGSGEDTQEPVEE